MRHLSSHKNQHSPLKTITKPHHTRTRSPPIPNNRPGLHHETPTFRRKRHYTYHHGPRLHQGSDIHTMPRDNRCRGSGPLIYKTHLPTLWNTKEDHIRPRQPLHSKVLKRTLQTTRDPSEHQHRLPPTNRWPIGTHKPISRTIPP